MKRQGYLRMAGRGSSLWLSCGMMLAASCAPLVQPKVNGLTANDAQAIAIRAVRTAERNYKLELQAFDTHPTPSGNYSVSLQLKTTETTAEHWRVVVHPDRSAEVVPAEPPESTAKTMHAQPGPLKGNGRVLTPTDPEPVRALPRD